MSTSTAFPRKLAGMLSVLTLVAAGLVVSAGAPAAAEVVAAAAADRTSADRTTNGFDGDRRRPAHRA